MRIVNMSAPFVAAWATSLVAASAFAQDAPVGTSLPPPQTPTPPPALPAAPAVVAPTPQVVTVAETPPTDAPTAPPTDHDLFVKRIAVGYFGVSSLPIAASGMAGSLPLRGTVNAPVVGVRYWFHPRVGVDAGLGFGFSNSDGQVNGASINGDTPTSFGFAVHGGLPLVIASASHYVFEIVPEATIGSTTGTISTQGASDQSVGGIRVDIGARAGAEIHFGFLGVPQLALQASIGFYFRHQTYTWSQDINSSSLESNTFTTSVQTEPWAIFVDNISALYYL
jgi:hypothetical protein